MVVLIDNYDSFTYNLVHYLEELGEEVEVIEANKAVGAKASINKATHLFISPGPGHPKDARASLEIIKTYCQIKPILGICLGHQCIALAFGGVVNQCKKPVHGKTSKITFIPNPLFKGILQEMEVMRYHSLVVSQSSQELEELAWSDDGVVMALRHREFLVYGVQFHPESILTHEGKKILKNFLLL